MEQGTKEWLEHRKTKVTSSDASALMGVGYSTPYKEWLKKFDLSPDQYSTPAMIHGNEMEPIALNLFNTKMGLNLVKDIVECDWRMSSLDGYDREKNIFVEIKCPFSKEENHNMAKEGIIPKENYPQMAHHFLETKADEGYFFSYFRGDEALIYLTKKDFENSYMDKLDNSEREFFTCIDTFTPPKLTDKDYVMREDFEFKELVEAWKHHKAQIEYHENREKNFREKIKILCDNKNTMGYGIKLTKVIRKGSVDYDLIPELQNINLDQYRKPSITTWRIT